MRFYKELCLAQDKLHAQPHDSTLATEEKAANNAYKIAHTDMGMTTLEPFTRVLSGEESTIESTP